MRSSTLKVALTRAILGATILLLGSNATFAQTVTLTAAPANASLPDGNLVPMWGYTCSAAAVPPATCGASNPSAGASWSPVVITVPPGSLTINLTNNLPSPLATSLVIVGQLGGGLGDVTQRTTTLSPDHSTPQNTTWPIAGDSTGPQFTPPGQAPRVQSFSTEVANAATTPLTWTALKPGTYLIESGTHPSIQGPMGLYGVLVVTTAPTTTAGVTTPGTAYPALPPAPLH